jgi:hypothetical protein
MTMPYVPFEWRQPESIIGQSSRYEDIRVLRCSPFLARDSSREHSFDEMNSVTDLYEASFIMRSGVSEGPCIEEV